VIDIVRELQDYDCEVRVHDPLASAGEARAEYGVELIELDAVGKVDAVVWAVAHQAFAEITPERLADLCRNGRGHGIVIDVKGVLKWHEIVKNGMAYWCL